MDPIEAAIEELDSHYYPGKIPYQAIARKYGVVDTTLRRRHRAENEPRSTADSKRQLLTPQQEAELVKWIKQETQGHQPPSRFSVKDKASILAGREVGRNWVYKFYHRHTDDLVFKTSTPMDRNRHKADSYHKYDCYFNYLGKKLDEYDVAPGNTYNMDEKGFALGQMNRSKRFFSKELWDRKQVRAPLQDGSREWITILACICADGTALLPGLIYQSEASMVQDSWVQDIDQDHGAFVAASPSGWTNHDLGLQWLIQVFDRQTKAKARRSWRLLYVDGHGSHLTTQFLDYCMNQKILVMRFPSHSTHTLQPLDVVAFSSLGTAYSQQLERFRERTHGQLGLSKADFFGLFWAAWQSSFSKDLIKKSFDATGLFPWNPRIILDRFEPEASDSGTNSSSSHLNSWNEINRRFREVVKDSNDRRTQHLNQALHHLVCFSQINEHEVGTLEEALRTKNKRKKPSKPIEPRDDLEETGGGMFHSPRKVAEDRVRKAAREEEERLKELRKAEAAAEKLRLRNVKAQEQAETARRRQQEKVARDERKRLERIAKDARKAERLAKKMAGDEAKVVKAQARTKAPKLNHSGGGGGGRKRGGGARGPAPAPPLPAPPTTSRGRDIKIPARFR